MANRVFTLDGNFNDSTKWDGGLTVPSAGDNITIDAVCTVTASDATVYGTFALNSGKTFALGNNSVVFGAATILGGSSVFSIGATGVFTCAGITVASGSTGNQIAQGGKIVSSGDVTISQGTIFNQKAVLQVTGNIAYDTVVSANLLYGLIIDSGKTMTMTGNDPLSAASSDGFVLNGTLAIGAFDIQIGGIITIGTNGDITGTNNLDLRTTSTSNVFNRTTPLSFSGTVECGNVGANNYVLPPFDFSNADVVFYGRNDADTTRIIQSGTVKCKSLTVQQQGGFNIAINNSTNNPNIEMIGGNFLLDLGGGSWTKGTGSITLRGASGTPTFNPEASATIEDIIVNTTGASYTQSVSFTTDSMTITAGTWNSSDKVLTISGNIIGDTSGKIITANANGLIAATGSLNVSGSKTYNDGFTIEVTAATADFNGIKYPSSSNINYIYNNNGGSATLADDYEMKSIDVRTDSIFAIGTFNLTVTGLASDVFASPGFSIGASSGTGLTCGSFSGTFNSSVAGSKINCSGNFVTSADASGAYNGTLTFTGGNATVSLMDYATFGDIIFNCSGTKSLSVGDSASIGDMTVVSGTVSAQSAGTNTSIGTFTGTSGRVIIDGDYAFKTALIFSSYSFADGFEIESKGTATWDGSSFPSDANINYIINGSGKTASLSAALTCKNISGTAGTLNSTVAGTQRTITATNTGTFTGMTVKDIAMNSANKINAKTNCVSQGNNLGIVFIDTVGVM